MFIEDLLLQEDILDVLEGVRVREGDCLVKTDKQFWLLHVHINLEDLKI